MGPSWKLIDRSKSVCQDKYIGMRKLLPIIVVLLIFGGIGFFFFKGKKTAGPLPGFSITGTTQVSLEERPFVTLTPRADGHEIKLEIQNIKNAQTVEYELAYMAGEFSRGTIGEAKLEGADSLSRNLLLGSESCSGTGEKKVCRYKYDEGVSEGTLTLRLRKDSSAQKYEIAFHLQQGAEAKKGLTSGDGNFEFKGSLSSSAFFLIHSTVGLPKAPDGKVIGGSYGIFTSGSPTVKGTVKLRLNQATQSVKVLAWDGSSWKPYAKGLATDGQTVSVEVDRLTTFVAVAP